MAIRLPRILFGGFKNRFNLPPTDIHAWGETFPPRPFYIFYITGEEERRRRRWDEKRIRVRFNASRPRWFNRSFTLRSNMGWNQRNAIYAGFIMEPGLWILLSFPPCTLFRELPNLRIRIPQRSSIRAGSGTCMRKRGHCSLFGDEFLPCCDPFVDRTWSFAAISRGAYIAYALRGSRDTGGAWFFNISKIPRLPIFARIFENLYWKLI